MKATHQTKPVSNPNSKSKGVPGAALLSANVFPVLMGMDFGHQQAVVATESACAMFRGFEAMCKVQEDAAHLASLRHAQAAEKLRGDCQLEEFMILQSELLRFDLDAAAQYWQQLAIAALEMQSEMMGCASHLMDSETLLAGSSALAAMGSKMAGLDAFQLAVEPLAKTLRIDWRPDLAETS